MTEVRHEPRPLEPKIEARHGGETVTMVVSHPSLDGELLRCNNVIIERLSS